MGWSYCGINSDTGEEMGYSVDGICHHDGCAKKINHGLAHVCGGMHENGITCEYYFCYEHLVLGGSVDGEPMQMCFDCYEKYADNED